MPYVELSRKLVRAAKIAKPAYFINVGGAGSLEIPKIEPHLCAADSGHFWRAVGVASKHPFPQPRLILTKSSQFRQAFADSESQIQYMEERLGPLGAGLRKLRSARVKVREGSATDEDVAFIKKYLQDAFDGDYSQTFVRAARVTWMFFEGDSNWNWSYASPPALYRPCLGGEEYHIVEDLLPMTDTPDARFYSAWYKDDPKDLEGRLRGISTVDFVRAIADDAETKFGLRKHWCPYTALKDDTPLPSYVDFKRGIQTRAEYAKC